MAYVHQDLLDRIRDLERDVRQLRGRAEMRPAMNRILNGEVEIGEGGSFAVRDPQTGTSTFRVGEFFPPDDGEFATVLRRRDGSVALSIYNGTADQLAPQTLRMEDAQGNHIIAEDIVGGGLARPYVPVPMAAGRDFTSTSWTTTHIGRWQVQHPVLRCEFSVFAGSGTAEARLEIDDGGLQPLGPTISSSGSETFATFDLSPSDHGQAFGDAPDLYLRGRITSGSGPATLWCRGMWGVQS